MMLEKLLVSFCSFGSNDTSGASSVNDGVSCWNACQENLNILFQRSFMYHVRKLQYVLNHVHRFSQVDVFTFDFLLGIFHRLCWLPVKGFLFITWRLDCRGAVDGAAVEVPSGGGTAITLMYGWRDFRISFIFFLDSL